MVWVLLLFVAGGGPAWAAGARIEKLGVGSSVKVQRAGALVRLKAGDELVSGDELTTDASTAVDIRLEDDTLIRVGVRSSYTVKEDSALRVLVHRLLSGVVRVLVKPGDREKKEAAIKFRLYTPEGTIGVRGTEFVVLRDEGSTQVKGIDGEVIFGPAEQDFSSTKDFVSIHRGFYSQIQGKGAARKPEKFDLKGYLNTINGAGGPFAPLADAGKGNVHKRVAAKEPAAAALPAAAAPAPVVLAQAPAAKPKEKAELPKVDWQAVLLQAVQDDNVDEAAKALKNGAQVNGVSKLSHGLTPLHQALVFDKQKMFLFLIEHGALVDARDDKGRTALMVVADQKLSMDYAKALVFPGGADLDMLDNDGASAVDHARRVGYEALARYLDSEEAFRESESARAKFKKRKK